MIRASLATELTFFGVISLWLLAIFPAAIVTVLKGRWLLFVAGWVSFGTAWFLGGIPIADPGSWWARRFYDEEKLARATEPERHRRPLGTAARWLGGTLALILALGAFNARPSPVLGVSGKTLQFSVDGGFILGTPSESCSRLGPRTWRCSVWDSQQSGSLPYRVEMHRFGCWTATRIGDYGGEGDNPKRFSDCITILDHLSI